MCRIDQACCGESVGTVLERSDSVSSLDLIFGLDFVSIARPYCVVVGAGSLTIVPRAQPRYGAGRAASDSCASIDQNWTKLSARAIGAKMGSRGTLTRRNREPEAMERDFAPGNVRFCQGRPRQGGVVRSAGWLVWPCERGTRSWGDHSPGVGSDCWLRRRDSTSRRSLRSSCQSSGSLRMEASSRIQSLTGCAGAPP